MRFILFFSSFFQDKKIARLIFWLSFFVILFFFFLGTLSDADSDKREDEIVELIFV